MNRSESITNLTKALFKFQSKIDNVSKDAVNPFFKSKYASLTSILDGIKYPLMESSLVIMQNPGTDEVGGIALNTIIMHSETGEYIESSFSMKPVKNDPQGIGSCISYMRRYALASILKLNVDDDDGNYSSNVGNKSNYVNNKVDSSAQKRSKEFLEIQTAITKSKTIDELNEAVSIINDIIETDKEKNDLRVIYIQQKDKIK